MSLEEQKKLTEQLAVASYVYYNGNGEDTGISDAEFDRLMHVLAAAEKENGAIFMNSPTQRVGTDALDKFKKVSHPTPMLTIENTYSQDELKEWINKTYDKCKCSFNVSVKYDGVSCELHYVDGVLMTASTRGDKNTGDDITANVRTIRDVPITIPVKDEVYVRGEIMMPKSQLARLNETFEKEGTKPFANTRNACSGSIKLLDSKEVAKRGLIFRAWDCFVPSNPDAFITMTSKFDYLEKVLGFKYESNTKPFSRTVDDVMTSVDSFKKQLDNQNLDFDYDGVVIKIDEIEIQNEIGTKDTRAIEWGIARKWNEEYETWTELQGVDWQVGRTGVITPVGLLDPVQCAGVLISNVTLHNADFVTKFDLHIGNDVKITRSGGVIPYVLEVKHDLLMEMNGAYPAVKVPDVCPVCGGEVVMDGKLLKCVNPKCPAKTEGSILQFCSKECCDIQTIGESVVHDLVSNELVLGIDDILHLGAVLSYDDEREMIKTAWLSELGKGYGSKTIDNIFDAIVNARLHTPLERIIAGLSIPNVGKVMARILCKRYGNVFDFQECTIEDLMKIDGIAETTATGIYEWIHNGGTDILIDIEQYGWNYSTWDDVIENPESSNKLEGMKVCFTGKSFRFKGDDVEKFLEGNGAKCASVSKSLDCLITGEKPGGSKVEKAKSLGIEILTEEEFYKKYDL